MQNELEKEERLALAFIKDEIRRTEWNLRNVRWFLVAGFSLFPLGLLIVWLWATRATLFVLGRTRFQLGDTYAIAGVFLLFIGLALIPVSINIRLRYPAKLKRLRNSLEKVEKATSESFSENV